LRNTDVRDAWWFLSFQNLSLQEFIMTMTFVSGALSKTTSRVVLTILLPVALAACATTAEREQDAKEAERQRDEAQSSTAGEYIDDSVITAKVKAALAEDDLVKAYEVNVKTEKGVVQLSGFVASDDVIARAGVLAAAVEGVSSVENDLIVK
jgi:osmotically-inducible protein OsmY